MAKNILMLTALGTLLNGAFFAFMMVLQLIWVKFMVPETKGIPLRGNRKRVRLLLGHGG
jgi:hypothetical protein